MPSPVPSETTPGSFKTYLEVKELPNTGPVDEHICHDFANDARKALEGALFAHAMYLNQRGISSDTCPVFIIGVETISMLVRIETMKCD